MTEKHVQALLGGDVMRALVLILLAPVLLPLIVLKTLLGLH